MIHQFCLLHLNKQKNLEQRPYLEALKLFDALMAEIDSFENPLQKRMGKIEKNCNHFMAFYFVEGAPATNNLIENYYSHPEKFVQ